ncbi:MULTISPECIES: Gfo/Idh/MocA family protein [unclassified Nonomuraea]|uniref:Gfo/Idh/MocA family protein n=1 Tax=unclassified Nonomuraea TaxID=2593643 RepID=UPI001378C829|nr:Gfo/Idh/MocA family oxidoreductase [Nonomuraea sp. KC401]NBE92566.1 Gfo/Idh/MocA family oxidoreductase [Nonomuraea sp. K271]
MTRTTENTSEPVRVAVVGLGNAGQQNIAAVSKVSSAEVVAITEPDPVVAARTDLPVRPMAEVLADPNVQVVALCLPPGDRYEMATAAFRASKHVLVEKPPARCPAELSAMLAAAHRAERHAAVMFQHRFALPETLRIGASAHFADAMASLMVSRPRKASHYADGGWRSRPDKALGGVTAHLGVHYLDVACQLLGEPVQVTLLDRTDAAPGIDTQLCGHVAFDSGAQLTIAVTSRSPGRFEQLTVHGANAWIELNGGRLVGRIADEEVYQDARPALELRACVYTELALSVQNGVPPRVSSLDRSSGVTMILHGLLQHDATTVAP